MSERPDQQPHNDRLRVRLFYLLRDRFDVQELDNFAFVYFPDVKNEFTPEMRKTTRAQMIVDYTWRRDLISYLVNALEKERPDIDLDVLDVAALQQASPAPTSPSPASEASATDNRDANRADAVVDPQSDRERRQAWSDVWNWIPSWGWALLLLAPLVVLGMLWLGNGENDDGNGQTLTATASPTASPSPSPTATRTPTPTPSPTATRNPNIPPPNPELGDTWTRPIDEMVMVYVPAPDESFTLESGVEAPEEGYWIDKYEVSNAQYQLCVAAGACERSTYADDPDFNGADYPVVGVSWFDAADYVAWLNQQLPDDAEWEYALPTEGAWEYAAVGDASFPYPWGDEVDGTRLNFCDANCVSVWKEESVDDGYELTAPVGSYPDGESWVGAADMAGNVWEWTASWYDEDEDRRVLRGGSWHNVLNVARSAYRYYFVAPDNRDGNVGFRLVVVRRPPSQ